MTESFCMASKCKVKRLAYFSEVEQWRDDGMSFTNINKKCREQDSATAPSIPIIAEHFNSHYPPSQIDLETFSPERMARELDKNIAECSRRIELLGDDQNQMRIVSQLMDTQKRLLELKLQNQQMFLEKEKTLPEQFDNLKEALSKIPPMYVRLILEALERDIHSK